MANDMRGHGLLELAWVYYHRRDYRRALRESSKPQALSSPECFEIQALALEKMGKKRRAIRVLEKGIKFFTDNPRLYSLLGNLYSDMRAYDSSKECYENALKFIALEDDFKLYILYNYANMLKRCDKIQAAQHKVSELFSLKEMNSEDREFYHACFSLKLSLHNRAQEYDKTEQAFKLYEESQPPSEKELYGDSDVYYEYAYALSETKRIKEAEDILLRSLRFNKFHKNTYWLLRQIRFSHPSASAKYMRLLLHGLWHDSDHCHGFFITYDVVADSEEEALGFIREIEPEEIRDTLKVENIKILKTPPQPKGIYKATEYFSYPLKNIH